MVPSPEPLSSTLAQALPAIEIAVPGRAELRDATEAHGLQGHADALALPRSADEVAAVLAWCNERDVAVPRAAAARAAPVGAVPIQAASCSSLARMNRVRALSRRAVARGASRPA